ncbi:hypothetical protein BC940DRAFT_346690 [Gongronella butleri]|nr:hypothetical protein BC940DRAFT_346690 [Gongronella butleri]
MNTLPMELVRQIVDHLPPASLLEMRLTCRFYCSLATAAYFDKVEIVIESQSKLRRLQSLLNSADAEALPIKQLRVQKCRAWYDLPANVTGDSEMAFRARNSGELVGMETLHALGRLAAHLPFLRSLFIMVPGATRNTLGNHWHVIQPLFCLPQLRHLRLILPSNDHLMRYPGPSSFSPLLTHVQLSGHLPVDIIIDYLQHFSQLTDLKLRYNNTLNFENQQVTRLFHENLTHLTLDGCAVDRMRLFEDFLRQFPQLRQITLCASWSKVSDVGVTALNNPCVPWLSQKYLDQLPGDPIFAWLSFPIANLHLKVIDPRDGFDARLFIVLQDVDLAHGPSTRAWICHVTDDFSGSVQQELTPSDMHWLVKLLARENDSLAPYQALKATSFAFGVALHCLETSSILVYCCQSLYAIDIQLQPYKYANADSEEDDDIASTEVGYYFD